MEVTLLTPTLYHTEMEVQCCIPFLDLLDMLISMRLGFYTEFHTGLVGQETSNAKMLFEN